MSCQIKRKSKFLKVWEKLYLSKKMSVEESYVFIINKGIRLHI